MGKLRENFWKRPLADLNRDEWEALCDGCGRCCTHKIEDADTGETDGRGGGGEACAQAEPEAEGGEHESEDGLDVRG